MVRTSARTRAHEHSGRPVARDDAPPEAQLIRERRETLIPRRSIRDLAADADIGESSWRAFEAGKFVITPERLARVALVVGVTPSELETLGRQHGRDNALRAAVLLRRYIEERVKGETVARAAVGDVPEEILQALITGLDEIRSARGISAKQRSVLERALIRGITAHISAQVDQIRILLGIADKGR